MHSIQNWRVRVVTWLSAAWVLQSVTPVQAQEPPGSNVFWEDCKPFAHDPGFASIKVVIEGHGAFCLTEDMKQRSVWDISSGLTDHGSPKRGGVIRVMSGGGLRIDLREHLVTGAPFNYTNGIVVDEDVRDVQITNGIVSTPGPTGLAIAMAPFKAPEDEFHPPEDEPPGRLIGFVDGRRQNRAWNYQPPTNYIADHLTITSGGRGVMIGGTGNVIRNCTIEVDSATAILSYGPNALIEGNTIIVHKTQADPTKGEPVATSAALKLRDADGTIIRNNRIVVKGGLFDGKAEAAINLLASHGVVIENNVIEGASRLVRKDTDSTSIERGNTLR